MENENKNMELVINKIIKFSAVILLFGTSVTYFILWFPFLLLSYMIPTSVYCFIDEKFFSTYQRFVLFFYETVNETKVIFSGDFDKLKQGKENVLYMSNHQSSVDWIVTHMCMARQGGIGRVRYILKRELKYIPLYGFYFHQHGCIYVNRGNFSRHKAEEQLRAIEERGNKVWLVIFPEGTRVMPGEPKMESIMSKSSSYAEKNNLEPLGYHLTPRVLGILLSLENLANHLDALYDVTVAYSDTSFTSTNRKRRSAPGLIDFFDKRRRTIHVHVNRIPINEIPVEEKSLQKWLHERFQEKDKVMEQYFNCTDDSKVDALAQDGVVSPLSEWESVPAAMFFLSINFFLWYYPLGRLFYLVSGTLGTLGGLVYVQLLV